LLAQVAHPVPVAAQAEQPKLANDEQVEFEVKQFPLLQVAHVVLLAQFWQFASHWLAEH
jgi:hypothetical protein